MLIISTCTYISKKKDEVLFSSIHINSTWSFEIKCSSARFISKNLKTWRNWDHVQSFYKGRNPSYKINALSLNTLGEIKLPNKTISLADSSVSLVFIGSCDPYYLFNSVIGYRILFTWAFFIWLYTSWGQVY